MKRDMPLRKSFSYLDYEIVSTTDGIVLLHHNPYNHLGNYSKVEHAKMGAVMHFMIARPQDFGQCVFNRVMHGAHSGTMSEWFIMRNVLEREKILMPEEITMSEDIDSLIQFKGKTISWKQIKDS